MAEGFLNFSQ